MSSQSASHDSSDPPPFTVLITGANRYYPKKQAYRQRSTPLPEIVSLTSCKSGLGFAICCRLIDEFVQTRPEDQEIHLIFTTRDRAKSADTLKRLGEHVRRKTSKLVHGAQLLGRRIQLEGILLDLTSLVSVKRCADDLVRRDLHIDALLCNAGIGSWNGFNWPSVAYQLTTDLLGAMTYPVYKIGHVGRTAAKQLGTEDGTLDEKQALRGSAATQANGGHDKPKASQRDREEPVLGETFTANVFGHYMLAHYLMPVLRVPTSSPRPAGRIIWVSSIEAHADAFHTDDFQFLRSGESYEASRRLTDLLTLSSELPSTKHSVSAFLDGGRLMTKVTYKQPRMYDTHPGVCATSIAQLNIVLHYLMLIAFYFARFLGSPWHPVSSYVGAVAGVWMILVPQTTIDAMEREGGKGKWGSSTDRMGNERVIRTEVAGWGWGGKVGETANDGSRTRKNRPKSMRDLTAESREEFEILAGQCWREMEELRVEWEARLEARSG